MTKEELAKLQEPLPRNRKIAEQGEVPAKDFIRPKIETKQVITGFTVGEREATAIKDRRTLVEWIRKEYPQITEAQMAEAKITYYEHHAKVELNEYSPPNV